MCLKSGAAPVCRAAAILFDPQQHRYRYAYLAILQNTHLGEISNPTSRRYAVITAYNGGAGSVLRVFHRIRKQAARIISGMERVKCMKPDDKTPSGESRNYLRKVNDLQKVTAVKLSGGRMSVVRR